MLGDAADEHCDTILNTLKFHLVDHKMENLRRLWALSVLDSNSHAYFKIYVEQVNKWTFATKVHGDDGSGWRDKNKLQECTVLRRKRWREVGTK